MSAARPVTTVNEFEAVRACAAFDAGGPVGALQDAIASRLAGVAAEPAPAWPAFPADPLVERLVSGTSRAAGPAALALCYFALVWAGVDLVLVG